MAYNVSMRVLIWLLPSMLDLAKMKSLVDTVQEDPDNMPPLIKRTQGGDCC